MASMLQVAFANDLWPPPKRPDVVPIVHCGSLQPPPSGHYPLSNRESKCSPPPSLTLDTIHSSHSHIRPLHRSIPKSAGGLAPPKARLTYMTPNLPLLPSFGFAREATITPDLPLGRKANGPNTSTFLLANLKISKMHGKKAPLPPDSPHSSVAGTFPPSQYLPS